MASRPHAAHALPQLFDAGARSGGRIVGMSESDGKGRCYFLSNQ